MRVRSLVGGMSAALALFLAGAALAQVPPVGPINQVQRQAAVTPTDNVALAGGATQALFVGTASPCNIAFIALNDTAPQTWQNVSAGILPVRAKVVMATNTTCTNIIALYWP